MPRSFSAPFWSTTIRESVRLETLKAMRVGRFALIKPVITSALGRWVAFCLAHGPAVAATMLGLTLAASVLAYRTLGFNLDPNALFSDPTHVNEEGARIYTRGLFELTGPLVRPDLEQTASR